MDFDSPTDLTGPLAQFQATIYGREQLLRMMFVISGRAGVSWRTVEHRFASHWSAIDDQVQLALKKFTAEVSVPERGKEDKTDEMLAILRRLQAEQRESRFFKASASPSRTYEVSYMDGSTYFVKAVSWSKKDDTNSSLSTDSTGSPAFQSKMSEKSGKSKTRRTESRDRVMRIDMGEIISVRRAAAVCNVSPPVVRRWLSLGLIAEPPWTVEQLHKVRELTDPEARRRGNRAPHGTITRWNAGCSLC